MYKLHYVSNKLKSR